VFTLNSVLDQIVGLILKIRPNSGLILEISPDSWSDLEDQTKFWTEFEDQTECLSSLEKFMQIRSQTRVWSENE